MSKIFPFFVLDLHAARPDPSFKISRMLCAERCSASVGVCHIRRALPHMKQEHGVQWQFAMTPTHFFRNFSSEAGDSPASQRQMRYSRSARFFALRSRDLR